MDRAARVLVVEDESLIRLMLSDMLEDLGHEVAAEASKLDVALELAEAVDYDLAILDLNLGDALAYPVADIARKRHKALVLATGYGSAGLRADYQHAIVLQKPFTNDGLSRAVRSALDERRY